MAGHEHRDRILGITLGMACGDALGAPVNGMARYEIEANHGKIKTMLAGGVESGETTLPTAQALAVADSLIKCRGFEALDMGLALFEISDQTKFPFDDSTLEILEKVGDSDDWENASTEAWLASGGELSTNQCLSRAPIIGIRNSNNLAGLIGETILACRLTCRDPRAIDASLAIAFMVSQLVHDPFEPNFLDRVIHFASQLPQDEIYQQHVLGFNEEALRRNSSPDALRPYLADPKICLKTLRSLKKAEYDDLLVSNDPVHTMAVAIWCLVHTNTLVRGLYRAVGLGGEACHQGAIAGALLGGRYGMSEIPDTWLKALRERSRIVSLTEMLIG